MWYNRRKSIIADYIMVLIIILLCSICLLPFIHLASKSISDNSFVLAKKVYFLPKGFNLEAYIAIFKDGQLTHSMLYSVLVTAVFTVLGSITTVMAAWPLSRRRLKGRIVFTFIIMFTMYFGAGLIPTYLLYNKLKMLNTMWVLILPLIFAPYNFLIMKTYFQSMIPDSLEESAYIDGASNTTILIRIVLPLSKPILATIALFLAVGRWNAYEDSKFFITKKSLHMIQYLLSMMVLSASEAEKISISEASLVTTTPEVIHAAAIMFVSIPVLCAYPFVQKYFVKGIMIGAIKG